VPLREKTLWRMLYETAARASEALALDVERLDLANRRAPVRSKGGEIEWVHWGTGTAHLLPHAAAARRDEPHQRAAVSLRAPAAPGTPAPAPRRLPAHRPRPARLRPRPRAPARYTSWRLHQLRHSAATHLGEKKVPLQLIMAKTRHRSPRNVMRYVNPGPAGVAEVTELLDPPRRQ
jgi:integrase